MSKFLATELAHRVRDHCLCLHSQRAARALARHFDDAFRPLELTSGQFSLLMALNAAKPPTIGSVAALLAMDRTTLTAALKPLERRGLVTVAQDRDDGRTKRLLLTRTGHALSIRATRIWRRTHDALDTLLADKDGASGLSVALQSVSSVLQKT